MNAGNAFDLKPHHCGISVPDLEASIAWYCDMLGFLVEARLFIEAACAKVAFLKHGDFRIELFEVEGAAPLPEDRRYPNLDLQTHGTKHIALAVQDVSAAVGRLKERGVDIAMDVTLIEQRPMAFIRDNAGNLVELVERPELWRVQAIQQ